MTTFTHSVRRIRVAQLISAFAASAVLVACGANSQLPASAALANRTVIRPNHGKSWMDPSAKGQKLLYISDFGAADVVVYTYPYLRLAGVLTGFTELRGECTDPSGYVWITDQSKGKVFEYAHGGTTPVNTLLAPDPLGCATSPVSGDLAVSYGSLGQIEIFHNAAGSAITVTDSNFAGTYFLGYDPSGNLFVDGYDQSGHFHYAELPVGSTTFTDITLNQTPAGAGNVQWDGKYMAIGDTGTTIYQTQGSTVVSSTTLGLGCVSQFYIVPSKRKVIAPDTCEGEAGVFAYPAGGSPLQTITGGVLAPYGAVLSK